ncbi:hypothetical protein ACT7DC_01805 [Bacillus cereus]
MKKIKKINKSLDLSNLIIYNKSNLNQNNRKEKQCRNMEGKERVRVVHLLELQKKVSITLLEEDWKRIEDTNKAFSQFFRELTLKEFKK